MSYQSTKTLSDTDFSTAANTNDVFKYNGTNWVGGAVPLDEVAVGDSASTLATSVGNITIDAQGNDTDIIFKGTTGNTDTIFLTLNGSEAGKATFNSDIDNGTNTLNTGALTAASLTCTAGATFGGGAGSTGATVTTDGQVTVDGRIISDNTTDATSTTDGAIQTDGGLSVAKSAVVGADLTVTDDIKGYSALVAPHASTKTIEVKVITKTAAHRYHGSGSLGYTLDGVEAPFLTLTPGRTYKFDQADSSNANHPLRFYYEAAKTTAYTTGVTTNGTPGSSGAYTQIVVSDTTPTVLHYQCSSHALMGNAVSTNSSAATSLDLAGTAVTASGIELNILDGVTASTTELNILNGVTATTAELNILDGVTSTAAELNILDGVTASTTELNLLDGGTTVGGSITIADADGFIINDNGTMKTIPASAVKTYAGGGGGGSSATIPLVTVVTASTSAAFASSGNNGDNERIYIVNNGSTAVDITLPALSGLSGKKMQIKRLGSANVTVKVQSGEKLENTTDGTFVLASINASITCVANDTGTVDSWYII